MNVLFDWFVPIVETNIEERIHIEKKCEKHPETIRCIELGIVFKIFMKSMRDKDSIALVSAFQTKLNVEINRVHAEWVRFDKSMCDAQGKDTYNKEVIDSSWDEKRILFACIEQYQQWVELLSVLCTDIWALKDSEVSDSRHRKISTTNQK